jgi:hypothetical protein
LRKEAIHDLRGRTCTTHFFQRCGDEADFYHERSQDVKKLSKACHFIVTSIDKTDKTKCELARGSGFARPQKIMPNRSESSRLVRTALRFRGKTVFGFARVAICTFLLVVTLSVFTHPLHARGKFNQESYGGGLNVSMPATEQELLQAVQDVVSNGKIEGTKEYNKDEYVSGAEQEESTAVFPKWAGPGEAFYKVRKNALDPRNFKDSGDSGTLAVRYVVQQGDARHTTLQIDAIFVDDFHHRAHLSNGSVESAEYGEVQDHLAKAKLLKQHTAEAEQRRQKEAAAKEAEKKRKQEQLELLLAQAPGETLEQHVNKLRHEAERLVGNSGAQLKSAPFHSATSLRSLSAGSDVVILIETRYWYGVETEDGEHGWIRRTQLEELP